MDVRVTGNGVFENAEMQVEKTHAAARVSLRPIEKGVYGAYSVALISGVMAAGLAGASPIYAFRWSSPSVNALLRRLRISAGTDVTAFTQGAAIFDVIRAQGFTVQDTGGASISLAGKSGAKSTRFPASQIQIAGTATGNIAIAGTATLTAGTRVLDTNAFAALVGSCGAAPANFPVNGVVDLYLAAPGDEPQEFQQNEGFVIRATVPATGTWRFAVVADYDEVDPVRYF